MQTFLAGYTSDDYEHIKEEDDEEEEDDEDDEVDNLRNRQRTGVNYKIKHFIL